MGLEDHVLAAVGVAEGAQLLQQVPAARRPRIGTRAAVLSYLILSNLNNLITWIYNFKQEIKSWLIAPY